MLILIILGHSRPLEQMHFNVSDSDRLSSLKASIVETKDGEVISSNSLIKQQSKSKRIRTGSFAGQNRQIQKKTWRC